MKPILFNTEMVKAIRSGNKTVTRRIPKPVRGHKDVFEPPYKPGDVLYVRETWGYNRDSWLYKADYKEHEWPLFRWHPSIHMPKKVARLFLRVKDVRSEMLQDITVEQVAAEGIDNTVPCEEAEELCYYCPLPESSKGVHCYGGAVHMCEGSHCSEAMEAWTEEFIEEFADLWDSTVKPDAKATHGWDANPRVWVIEFEVIGREEASGHEHNPL